ncbi:MAG: hypothetical protein OWQ51_07155 [Pyrobaculum arsenaticum]|uniref:hypothetical protein n=1 Tax=Pyrobaculum arsenaticum TaxID=121277 RepID=UPI0022730DEC|nr:hypothetical protein [Pyrobaculum arsenaticum]
MPSSPSSLFSSTAWLRPGWYWMLSSLASKLQISLAAAARVAVNFAVANFDRIDVRRVLEELEGAPPPPSYKPQLGRLREVRLYMYDYAVKRLKKLLREALGLDKVSHGYVVAFSAAAYMMYARREALGPVLADMLRQVYIATRGEASWERRKRALSELYRRLEAVRALSKREGRDYVSMWLAIIKEVEQGDPLSVLAKYLGGDVPKIAAVDHYRQLWAKLLEDSGGDPRKFAQLFWLRKDGIRAAARNKAQREAVDAIAGLVDSRPDMAVEYAKAIVDGRYVKLEREVDRGEVRRRAEEWLEAFRNIFAKTYLEARERGVWLGSAALGKGDVLKRFYRWYKRYGRYLDGELARRLAPVVKLAELHDMYLRLLGEGAPWRGEAEALVNVGKEASNALMEFLIQEGIFHRHEQRP